MKTINLIFIIAVIISFSRGWAQTRIRCQTKPSTPIAESAWMDLTLSPSKQIIGAVAGMSWHSQLSKYIEFKFENQTFSIMKNNAAIFSSGEIQKEIPRYVSDDGRFPIDQKSVSVVLITFNKLKTKAQLFFYQRYFLFDLFVDGGQRFNLDCEPRYF